MADKNVTLKDPNTGDILHPFTTVENIDGYATTRYSINYATEETFNVLSGYDGLQVMFKGQTLGAWGNISSRRIYSFNFGIIDISPLLAATNPEDDDNVVGNGVTTLLKTCGFIKLQITKNKTNTQFTVSVDGGTVSFSQPTLYYRWIKLDNQG